MEPFTMIVVPGLLGGIVLALVFVRLQRRERRDRVHVPYRANPLSTDVINMSRIRVAGVGGLGLVAMAVAVAWFVPRIGQMLLLGLISGVVLAAAMIAWRRRAGPMPSSGRRPGANAMLGIDDPDLPAAIREQDRVTDVEELTAAPVIRAAVR